MTTPLIRIATNGGHYVARLHGMGEGVRLFVKGTTARSLEQFNKTAAEGRPGAIVPMTVEEEVIMDFGQQAALALWMALGAELLAQGMPISSEIKPR